MLLTYVIVRCKRSFGDLLVDRESVQLLMATATLSKAVKKLLESHFDPDLSEAKNLKLVNPNRLPEGVNLQGGQTSEGKVPLKILEVSGLHKSLPGVKHVMMDTKGADKLETLLELLSNQKCVAYCCVRCLICD